MRRIVPMLFACLVLSACGPVGNTSRPTTQPTTKPTGDERNFQPCHPGCFPKGTLVATPSGPREIQSIRPGETVTLVTAEGKTEEGKVESVFETLNNPIEVQTDAGTIRTTETQPLCRTTGGFVSAGELKAGDIVWRWADGRRTPATVVKVERFDGTAKVFNLVVGTDRVFIAGGFLARGKPVADR